MADKPGCLKTLAPNPLPKWCDSSADHRDSTDSS